jgi:hypothetical protein
VLEPKGRGVLDAPHAHARGMTADRETQLFVLAARKRPSYSSNPPSNYEGAGKAGCPPHPWSACNKKHAAEPQVQADHPAFPARWFYGLYVISPVTMLGCHRRP